MYKNKSSSSSNNSSSSSSSSSSNNNNNNRNQDNNNSNCNNSNNGLINRVFMLRTVVTKHAQGENVTEIEKFLKTNIENFLGLVSIEPDFYSIRSP